MNENKPIVELISDLIETSKEISSTTLPNQEIQGMPDAKIRDIRNRALSAIRYSGVALINELTTLKLDYSLPNFDIDSHLHRKIYKLFTLFRDQIDYIIQHQASELSAEGSVIVPHDAIEKQIAEFTAVINSLNSTVNTLNSTVSNLQSKPDSSGVTINLGIITAPIETMLEAIHRVDELISNEVNVNVTAVSLCVDQILSDINIALNYVMESADQYSENFVNTISKLADIARELDNSMKEILIEAMAFCNDDITIVPSSINSLQFAVYIDDFSFKLFVKNIGCVDIQDVEMTINAKNINQTGLSVDEKITGLSLAKTYLNGHVKQHSNVYSSSGVVLTILETATEFEKKILREIAESANLSPVKFISPSIINLAAAELLNSTDPIISASMTRDAFEIIIVSKNKIIAKKRMTHGETNFCTDAIKYILRNHNVAVSDKSAYEAIKHSNIDHNSSIENTFHIKGMNRMQGLPTEIVIDEYQIREALLNRLSNLASEILFFLEDVTLSHGVKLDNKTKFLFTGSYIEGNEFTEIIKLKRKLNFIHLDNKGVTEMPGLEKILERPELFVNFLR